MNPLNEVAIKCIETFDMQPYKSTADHVCSITKKILNIFVLNVQVYIFQHLTGHYNLYSF
jgi:hypothetical protein